MRHAPIAAALAAALLSCTKHAATAAPPPAAAPPVAAPADAPPLLQLSDDVRPVRYALDLEIVPARAEGFQGSAAIEVELAAPRAFVWMHGRGLRVSRAEVEAAGTKLPATFAQVNEDGLAKLSFEKPIGPGRATLHLAWEAPWETHLVGLYLAREGGEVYAATQLEAIYARRVFPGFDEPRFKTPFEVTLTVPAAQVAVSNGPVASEEPAGGGLRRVRFAQTEPLPTYLLFFGVGPFDVVTPPPLPPNEVRDRPLPVRLLAPKGRRDQLRLAADATAALVPYFERYFGIPFPYAKLDQIAVPEFASGGMENAGAIAYRTSLLAESKGTSDEDRRAIVSVIAHEIAHEWFGDLVTLPWWTDAWLNESFATWAGQRASKAWQPSWSPDAHAFRSLDRVMEADAVASARAIRQPLRTLSDVFGQFDGMSYQKGAAVLRSFERFAGEDRFRDGIRAYLSARRHGTGSAEALFAELSRAAGVPLAPALAELTDRPGAPMVSARVSCEPGRARLLLAQVRWVPRGSDAKRDETWHVPVCARWEASGALRQGCTLLQGAEGALDLGPSCPEWVMPHADAASYHRWTLAPPDLARLRTSGLARLSTVEKISLVRNLRAAQQSGATPWVAAMEAIEAVASDPDPDVAVEPAVILARLQDRFVPQSGQPPVAALARRLYRPVLARLGWDPKPGETFATRHLREVAIDLLALTAGDPVVLGEATLRGRALLGLDGKPPRPDAVDPGLAEVSVAAAVRVGGPAGFDAVLAKLATMEDPALREKLVAALGLQLDLGLAQRAAGLWRGKEVKPHEYRHVFWALGSRKVGRAAMLGEMQRDLDGLGRALPGGSLAFVPAFLSGGCEIAFAEEVRGALEPHVPAHPEMRRMLAQTIEQIRICAAEREEHGAEARDYFIRAARAR